MGKEEDEEEEEEEEEGEVHISYNMIAKWFQKQNRVQQAPKPYTYICIHCKC